MNILNYPKYKEALQHWQPLSDIPNQRGFRFVGLRKDGLQIECTVGLHGGLHCITPGEFLQYTSWRSLTTEDERALADLKKIV